MSRADVLRSRLGLNGQSATNGADANGDVAVRPPFLAVINDRTVEILAHRRGSSIAKRRGWLVRRALLLADVIGIVVGISLVSLYDEPSAWYALLAVLALMLGKLYGLYDGDEGDAHHSTVGDLIGVFHVFTVSAFLMIVVSAAFGTTPNLGAVVVLWASTGLIVTFNRGIARAIVSRSISYQQNAVIVGAGDVGQLIGRKILQHPEYGINVVGFVDANPKEPRRDLGDLTILGTPDDLAATRLRARRRPRDRRLLRRVERGDARARPGAARPLDADRHRAAPVRGCRAERRHPLDRRPAADGIAVGADHPYVALVQARDRRRRRAPCCSCCCPRSSPSSPGRSSEARPAPSSSSRSGSRWTVEPFTMLKFRTMYVGTDESVHRDYIRDTMVSAASPTSNGLYKLSGPIRSRRSATGCGERASTSLPSC